MILLLKTKLDEVQCEINKRFFSLGPFLLTDENQNKGRVGDCRSRGPLVPAFRTPGLAPQLSFPLFYWGAGFIETGLAMQPRLALHSQPSCLFSPHSTFVYGRWPWL